MDMKKFFVVLFFLTAVFAFGQDRGLVRVAGENLGNQVQIGKQYALFIAIDSYRSWLPLKKPVEDAMEIRDILRQDYYIDEVIELYNGQATKQNIIRTFTDLQSKLGVHDSLFIYYAGHGHLDKNSDAGFWIPVDGGTDQFAQENWLPNSQIRGYISRFKTIHVFLVSDACFSGDILNTTRSMPPQIDNAYYRRAYSITSRQVLTSGSSETVPDQSEFSAALINCLRKNSSPLLDPLGIYNDVRLSVGKTTPLYGTLNASNHQEGATFLFFRRQVSAVIQPAPVPDNMVRINGGTFTMGSPANEPERSADEVQHQVTVSSFYMGKYEVTQREYQEVMGTNPSYFKGDNLPVENVSWYDAVEYCNKRSQREGLTAVYTINKNQRDPNNYSDYDDEKWTVTWNRNANGYRLPTEAEWEYACRAGTTTPFSTGNNITTNQANYGNGGLPLMEKTMAVGSFLLNAWGLYDMHGNVWEWCWDWFGEYSSRSQTDPVGVVSGDVRVLRGGNWANNTMFLRSANRGGEIPSYGYSTLIGSPIFGHGFRLVRN
jgi:formylglycine-generating enzyme required for sulfatase activity